MPIQKFVVETDKGKFVVEVDVPEEAKPAPTADEQIRAARAPGFNDRSLLSAAASGFVEGATSGAK